MTTGIAATFTFPIELSRETPFGLIEFYEVVFLRRKVTLSARAKERLLETRGFVDYLLQQQKPVYGLTTGFADLRKCPVSADHATQLSINILRSHDAGIGKPLDPEVVLGAMLLAAHSLSMGYSAFKLESLQTLIGMINHRILPEIPSSGSLGASGDLAFLARLGRAMCGEEVAVTYDGKSLSAGDALIKAGIAPFRPGAKEGLALTNGTAFMTSMLAIGYIKEIHQLENILALETLFLNTVSAVDAAYYESLHHVRGQEGQKLVAKILSTSFKDSPFIDRQGIQNDYSTRCLPQIFGPKIEAILSCYPPLRREMNAVTDNPLLFKDEEISRDVEPDRILSHNGSKWMVVSGGNFHGEYLTTIADTIATANVKIALTMERQMTFLMNPWRNDQILPPYLIADPKNTGLLSGFMIVQYTANALAQKISALGQPTSIYNLTSANESEDVVSYGATAAEKLLQQQELLQELTTLFCTAILQAYAIQRNKSSPPPHLISERLFAFLQKGHRVKFPLEKDLPFSEIYEITQQSLLQDTLRHLLHFPLMEALGLKKVFKQQGSF